MRYTSIYSLSTVFPCVLFMSSARFGHKK
ncbi:hypothetical protein S091751_0406 [Staphylococcus aureus subsp. aureus 091751]|nr:hypothetical protein S091751_0406 [Staphylococcus aureus subsp. aureus 091751]